MAKIGLENFRYSKLTEQEDGTPTYAGAKKPANAISCKVDVSTNSANLYADNKLVENDSSFQSGTVTIGIDEDDDKMIAELLGHKIDEQGEMTCNANDTAPYVGLGRIVNKMVNGARKFKVEFLYKVKFQEPSADESTKGESLEFSTSELQGTVSTLANGDWKKAKTFDTHQEAITYLEGLLKNASV